MPYSGVDQNPYPNTTDVPDGPGAFLALAQRLTLMKGAGIGYASDATALAAMITNGDAFTGLSVYHAAADCVVRYNGSAFKLDGVKAFANGGARNSWATTYSGLLQSGSESFLQDTETVEVYVSSTWMPFDKKPQTHAATFNNITVGNGIISATYMRHGKMVHCQGSIKFGTTTSMGSAPQIILPFAGIAKYGVAGSNYVLGQAGFLDRGTAFIPSGTIFSQASTALVQIAQSTGGAVTASAPFSWSGPANDELSWDFWYEAA